MNRMRMVSPLLLLGLAACNRSPQDALQNHLETIHSWAATADMVAVAWSQGKVPRPYAQQTLDKAQQQMQQEVKSLTEEAGPPPPALRQPLQQLPQTVQHLSHALAQSDRAMIAASLQQLAQQAKQLESALPQGAQP